MTNTKSPMHASSVQVHNISDENTAKDVPTQNVVPTSGSKECLYRIASYETLYCMRILRAGIMHTDAMAC